MPPIPSKMLVSVLVSTPVCAPVQQHVIYWLLNCFFAALKQYPGSRAMQRSAALPISRPAHCSDGSTVGPVEQQCGTKFRTEVSLRLGLGINCLRLGLGEGFGLVRTNQ